MPSKKRSPIDIKKLSKKYKLNVKKIIHAWKNNKTDMEISEALNVDLLKLLQLRQDVEDAHIKARRERIRNSALRFL